MVSFEGTCKEFHDHFGPKVRSRIASITKSVKNTLGNRCQRCGNVAPSLDAAHRHGLDRKTLVCKALEKYSKNGDRYVVDDLDKIFAEIEQLHTPINDVFMFLCRSCHKEYDDFGKQYDTAKKPSKSRGQYGLTTKSEDISTDSDSASFMSGDSKKPEIAPSEISNMDDCGSEGKEMIAKAQKKWEDDPEFDPISDSQKSLIPKPGTVLTNDDLREQFKVKNSGGIRKSITNSCILLINSSVQDPVLESFSDKVYEKEGFVIYTGSGAEDQEFTRMNSALCKSKINRDVVLYFEKSIPKQYVYKFRVQYVTHYKCKEKNDSGKSRSVIKFVLKILDD